MVSLGKELSKVRGVHPLDNVSTEQAGDVVTKAEIDRALKLQTRVRKLQEIQLKTMFELAATLKEIRDKRYYKILGYDGFEPWLSAPENDLDKSKAYRYIKVYEEYVLTGAFTKEELYGKSISKLEMLLPYVTPGEKGWAKRKREIHGMLELSRADLAHHLNDNLHDTRYTPERPVKSLPAPKTIVQEAQFEDISNAKTHSVEQTVQAKANQAADAAFDQAVKATVETRKIVSTKDVKKEVGLGGWYRLVACDPQETAGKSFKGVTLHIAELMRKGGEIYLDIE